MSNDSGQTTRVGIDHIAAYVPGQYLPLEALAEARGVQPSKYLVGIGIEEMAIPAPSEDVVVLAANAGHAVLEAAGVSPDDVGLLIVGTESAEDKAKPTATQVHGLLGISNTCRVYDIIHACAGATYGVLTALDWARNSKGKYALVIASDIAKYGIGAPGEPTQGAGAVAMLISTDPRLMALEEIGCYSKNVYDFWKPLDREYPIVKGVFSAECYHEAAVECFRGNEIDETAAFLYHTPYSKLVKQAHQKVVKMMGPDLDWKEHYEKKVACSHRYSARVGNIYTGSLWLSLVSFLENCGAPADEYGGCYLFSYGSGCGAVLMRGDFSATWATMAAKSTLGAQLDDRVALSVAEYEKLMYPEGSVEWTQPPRGHYKFDGVREDENLFSDRVTQERMSDKYDEFTVGYKGSFTKPVTEKDNIQFADISGDYNPIHFVDEAAQAVGFEGRISNGFVTESRVAGALVETFGSDETLVVAIEKNTRFLKPVYMDDVITATVEVVGRIESMRVLRIKAECRRDDGDRVAVTKMLIRILKRP